MKLSLGKKAILFIILILFLDQALKIWIKTNMVIGEEIHLFGRFGMLHFIENNGMAFGMEMGGRPGKLILSIFRIIAICGIGWYLNGLIRKKTNAGLILIDSAFYGIIFSESTYDQVALLFPPDGGYSSFLHGRVVDMFYFPVINTHWPDWSPFRPGQTLVFFRPVFNFSDTAITCGVFSILIFQKWIFAEHMPNHPETTGAEQV
jgi:signal peptidase II